MAWPCSVRREHGGRPGRRWPAAVPWSSARPALNSHSEPPDRMEELVASEAGPSFDPLRRSRACADGVHQDCGHVGAAFRRPASPGRLESAIVLCRCACHAVCLLADRMPTVSLTVWQALCECPGAEKQRSWKENSSEPWPGAKEVWERTLRKSRERNEAHRQARRATREAAGGMSRSEIRDMFIAELQERGQEIPPEPFLDAHIDLLTGHLLRGFTRMWKARPKPSSDL
jgi:hypothetical protein